MASVFSLQPLPSSSFICPLKTTKFQTLQSFQKPFLISSFQSTELDPKIPQPVQTFWQWLCDEGVVTAKTPVKPGIVPEGLGLVAKRDISKGETVLQVPRRSEEELSEIQGTQLLSETMSVKDYWQNEFRKVEEEVILRNKQLFPFPITLDDFFWAYGILKSRAFSSIGSQNLMLVPLADLVNHSAKVATEGHVQEVEGPAGLFSWDLLFSLRSPLELKAGDQFLVQYGLNKRNADLAFGYGFIEPNSARDAFTLTLEISESDDFYEDKLDIAESNGLGKTAEFNVKLGQSLPPTLIPYLRLVALGGTDAFLLESISRNDVWGHLELPVSRANEELICKVVRGTCKSALSGYHTTIEEDEKLMEKGNLSSRLQIAVGIRAGEKKVLQQIDDIFGERELKLDKLEYYQERRLKDQVTLC
ncbi:ribulose-1,5 bisphosphate carboxylase/oxygenase large subunit N-methyltransferase, chloroplastic-like isoform X4 [Lycium barbarum]|uniref:ribulose-1,5 bisphosphate carboxylase/oxygenase large subunit N-methyltransferase, chloroplastic-like isoform X4 n=1 Tax=Lycium barbarum TaxID=112863 RepID=UPI00293EB739|nr:ribulose-1,5 bisphosphate carboxylase/oxygenase large subunit N-methyltransferase, chloroplastic-like isoform X4 [Lycium barbarum]